MTGQRPLSFLLALLLTHQWLGEVDLLHVVDQEDPTALQGDDYRVDDEDQGQCHIVSNFASDVPNISADALAGWV